MPGPIAFFWWQQIKPSLIYSAAWRGSKKILTEGFGNPDLTRSDAIALLRSALTLFSTKEGYLTISNNPSKWIETEITTYCAQSVVNRLGPETREKIFDTPLVGFSSGSDPLYDEYVAHIGDFYLTPATIYPKAFPDASMAAGDDLTVISWILPSTPTIRQDQAGRKKHPAQRWLRTKLYGEAFNDALRRHVVATLAAQGIDSVAPLLADFWTRSDQGPYAPCSNWSERHAAHAAGLGTFGLCDGLITPVAKAMRTGPVVARWRVEPTPRPYNDHHAYCLFFSHGTCGKCMPRCPVKAISPTGHDKQLCMQYTERSMPALMKETCGLEVAACGLCQADVPCMDRIPEPEDGL